METAGEGFWGGRRGFLERRGRGLARFVLRCLMSMVSVVSSGRAFAGTLRRTRWQKLPTRTCQSVTEHQTDKAQGQL